LSYIHFPSVGSLTHDLSSFISEHPSLGRTVKKYGLAYGITRMIKSGKGRGLSRRQARKIANRARRHYIDNIIMHHKRVHDRNRKLAINDARNRALIRAKKKKELASKPKPKKHLKHEKILLANSMDLKKRGDLLREKARMKKVRAESRWASIIELQRTKS